MVTRTKRSTHSMETYHKFIRGLELEGIWLSKAHLELRQLPMEVLKRKVEIGLKPVAQSYENRGKNSAIVTTVHRLFGKDESSDEVITIEVGFNVKYTTATPIDDDLFDLFAQRVLPSHVVPYLREFVQNAFVRMSLPSLTLPIWKSPILKMESTSKAKKKPARAKAKRTLRPKESSKATTKSSRTRSK